MFVVPFIFHYLGPLGLVCTWKLMTVCMFIVIDKSSVLLNSYAFVTTLKTLPLVVSYRYCIIIYFILLPFPQSMSSYYIINWKCSVLFHKLKWGYNTSKNHIRPRPISKYPMSKPVLGCAIHNIIMLWSKFRDNMIQPCKSLFKAHYSQEFYEIVSCNWPLSIITVREHIPILILKTEIYTISVVSFLNWFLISVGCMPLIQQEILFQNSKMIQLFNTNSRVISVGYTFLPLNVIWMNF